MLFTQTEKDIAKQILKIGLLILVIVVLFSFASNFVSNIQNSSPDVNTNISIPQNIPKIKQTQNTRQELPMSIEVPDYGVSSTVEAPGTTDVNVLDSALSRGPVYYPGSGVPGSNNTLIFGHSTTFPVVINKAYQVFNQIKNIKPGTIVYVRTQDNIYMYKTRDVKRVSKYTSWVQFVTDTPMITLSTCDSFGKAADRWVLEGDYIGIK